jgi:Tol biopolymer transport system component/DNA-binding winged helix-turn-helix (wHTH) protein
LVFPFLVLTFGEFELDPARYELRKRGRRVKLQRIPMELLLRLAERPGELVLRSSLSQVWNSHDPAEVERNINTAVRKVRQALGDDAGRPRFVETVAGKGYRFIAKVSNREGQPVIGHDEIRTPFPDSGGSRAPWLSPSRYGYAIAILGIACFAAAILWVRIPAPAPRMRVTPFTALSGSASAPAFSPDGGQVAFSWAAEGRGQHLYVKASAGGPETRLTASPDADSHPAWSPNGRLIAFLRENSRNELALWVVSAAGGAERKVRALSTRSLSRISWSADGNALAVLDSDSLEASPGIFLVSLDSGEERRLTMPPNAEGGDWQPAFSADGRKLAFVRNTGSLQTGALYLLQVDRRGLAAGKPAPIPADRSDLNQIEWSADGRSLICAVLGGLVRIPVGGGAAEPLPFEDATDLSVAQGGHRLVFTHAVQRTAIFRLPGPGNSDAIGKLIASSRYNGAPKYSPDGQRIVFMSDRTGIDELWLTDAEGQNARQLTSFGRATLGSPRWSPDSRRIAFDSTADGKANIYVIDAEGGVPRRITSGGSSNVRPSWSHDGASVYFGSNRSGAWEIWKSSLEGLATVQVTHGGGREAVEDRAGQFLYYTKAAPAPGVWRVPVPGGAAELLCDEGVQGGWAIGQRGLYYLDAKNELALRDFSTRGRIAIPAPGLRLGTGSGGLLGIAPDDRWILVTALVGSESDLFMVEDFH